MAYVEIDEARLGILEQAEALLKRMAQDPKSKPYAERALKEVVPGYVPEDERAAELAKPYIERVEAVEASLKERLDALAKREEDAKNQQEIGRLESQFSDLRRAGYTDDGIENVKKIMVDRGIADVEAAAALHAKLQPPVHVDPTSYEPEFYRIAPDAGGDLSDWFKNPDRQSDIAIAETLRDLRMSQASI